MIPYKFNPLGVSNNKSNNGSSSNNISSFKIQGNSLTFMEITPVEDCVVDFGDGQQQTFTGNKSSTSVRHNYSEWDIYTIKIIGNHSHFRAPQNTIEIIQISNSVTNCLNMFYFCSSLTTISEGFIIPNSVTDCSRMFSYCSNLTAIPSTLTIPNSVTNCDSMFDSCSSLTSDISNIWPSAWNYTGTINISYMFYNCVKVVGTVPADKLWNSGKTFSSSSCFYNCTSLTNYSEIPAGWK